MRLWFAGGAGLVTAVAFGLRLFRLDHQSLWYDEAISFVYAKGDLASLFHFVSQDNHPPLYFLLLHLWMTLAGSSEYALRFLSVFPGILLIPLLYQLGRLLLTSRGEAQPRRPWIGLPGCVGLLAALLVAVSPMHIFYSQEARMYTWATLLATGALTAALQALETGQRRFWIAYGTLGAAALYTHYYAGLALAGFGAYMLIRLLVGWLRSRGRLLAEPETGPWVLSSLLLLLPLLPWASVIVDRLQNDATFWPGSLDFWVVIRRTLQDFGPSRNLAEQLGAGPEVALFAVWGLGLLWLLWSERRNRLLPGLFLTAAVLAPVLLLLGLTSSRPKFDTRYLLSLSPLFYLGIAAALGSGLDRMRGKQGWLVKAVGIAVALFLALLFGGSAAQALVNSSFDPQFERPDFRNVARYIRQYGSASDGVIVIGGHAQVLFEYYPLGGMQLYPMPDHLLPSVRDFVGESVADELNQIGARHQRVWLVLWQRELGDPSNIVLDQLTQNRRRLEVGEWFRGVDLLSFAMDEGRPFEPLSASTVPFEATFAGSIGLVGYSLAQSSARPGESIELLVLWESKQRVTEDFFSFVHLLSAGNHVYGQMDKRPPSDFYPTSRWCLGDLIRDRYRVVIPLGTPPGLYTIEAGLYRPNGKRLPVDGTGGDRVVLGQVRVVPGPVPGPLPTLQHAQGHDFGPIALLGYELERQEYAPGARIPLRLYWKAGSATAESLRVALRLVDASQHSVAERESVPVDGAYPTDRWRPGEIVRDTLSLDLPPVAPAGLYTLQVGLRRGKDEVVGPDQWLPLATRITLK